MDTFSRPSKISSCNFPVLTHTVVLRRKALKPVMPSLPKASDMSASWLAPMKITNLVNETPAKYMAVKIV